MNSIVAQERIIALRKKRSAQDLRFKYYGFIAMCLALAVLVFLLYSIFSRGFSAFQKTTILLVINYDQEMAKFSERNEMVADTWTNRVLGRMGKLSAMNGREKLMEILNSMGFPIR